MSERTAVLKMDGEVCKFCHTSVQSNLPALKIEESVDNVPEKEKCISEKSVDPIEDISNQFNETMNIEPTSPNNKVRGSTIRLGVKSGKLVPSRCFNIKKQVPSNSTFGDSKRLEVLAEALRQKALHARKEAKILGDKFHELSKSGLVTESVRRAFFDEAMSRLREHCNEISRLENIVKSGRCVTSESVKNRRSISVEPMKSRRSTSVEPMKNRISVTVEPMGPENRVTVEPMEHNRPVTMETMENSGHLTVDPMEDIAHQFKSKVNIGANCNSVMSKDDHKKMIEECRKTIKSTNLLHGFIEAKAQAEGKKHNLIDQRQLKYHAIWTMFKRLHFSSRHEKKSDVMQRYREFHARFLKRLAANANKNSSTS